MGRRTLTREQKDAILERDCWICAYCDGIATVVDHVVPFSWSFCDDPDNLVACCQECNEIAYKFVFPSFTDKRMYIRTRRKGKKLDNRFKIPYCLDCGAAFKQRTKGTTVFLCRVCNKLADYDTVELRRIMPLLEECENDTEKLMVLDRLALREGRHHPPNNRRIRVALRWSVG